MKLNNFFKLVIAIVVLELAGVIGSVFTISAIPNPSKAMEGHSKTSADK